MKKLYLIWILGFIPLMALDLETLSDNSYCLDTSGKNKIDISTCHFANLYINFMRMDQQAKISKTNNVLAFREDFRGKMCGLWYYQMSEKERQIIVKSTFQGERVFKNIDEIQKIRTTNLAPISQNKTNTHAQP